MILFGVSLALLVRAEFGLSPWDVFHQGVASRTGWALGAVLVATSLVVLLVWIPLRERPGIGTVLNAVLVGVILEATLAVLPTIANTWIRVVALVAGIAVNGVATGMYIGAGLGPGPRDGLMTGLAKRGWPIGRVRFAIEILVVATGWLMGGTVGAGTIVFAVSIGPLVQIFLPIFTITPGGAPEVRRGTSLHAR